MQPAGAGGQHCLGVSFEELQGLCEANADNNANMFLMNRLKQAAAQRQDLKS